MKYLLFAFIATLFLASCTGMLWERSSYDENIHSLYIEDKSNSFVVLGKSFHYVFKVKKGVIDVLRASQEIPMTPLFYAFKLDSNNGISGSLSLYVHKDNIFDNEVAKLKSLGFDDSNSYNHKMLEYDLTIKGIRYKINTDADLGRTFRKTYKVTIYEPRTDSKAELAAKALATPVTVAADAVLFIFGSVLYGISFSMDGG